MAEGKTSKQCPSERFIYAHEWYKANRAQVLQIFVILYTRSLEIGEATPLTNQFALVTLTGLAHAFIYITIMTVEVLC